MKVVDQMDVIRRGVRCHPYKGSKESKFCQVLLYSSLSLSKRNQLIVHCLSLVDGLEIDREDVEEFFECRNPTLSSQIAAK